MDPSDQPHQHRLGQTGSRTDVCSPEPQARLQPDHLRSQPHGTLLPWFDNPEQADPQRRSEKPSSWRNRLRAAPHSGAGHRTWVPLLLSLLGTYALGPEDVNQR